MNGKFLGLFKDMGWMTISNFASKMLVFLMVPFYTHVLTTEEYGLYDIGYTAATLVAPLITFNIAESLMRFALAEENETSCSFSTAGVISTIGAAGSVAIGLAVQCIVAIPADYRDCITFSGLISACSILYSMFSQFARGVGRVKDMAFGGLLNALFLVLFNFLFVLVFGMGADGCYIAAALSMLLAGLFIALKIRFWSFCQAPSVAAAKRMIRYGMPLGINTIAWWVSNVFGRYVVAAFCGLSNAGLLAAAYKIPSVPKVMQQIFVQAWQISSIKNFDKNDTDGFFRKTYDAACLASAVLTSFVIACIPLLAAIMFASDYYDAWHFVPLIMVGVVFNCLASVVGGIFMAVGDSTPIASSALLSVIASIAASFAFVPAIGVQGAAIASVVSSVSVWALRIRAAKRYVNFNFGRRIFILCMTVLTIQIFAALVLPLGFAWALPQCVCLVCLSLVSFRKLNITQVLRQMRQKIDNRSEQLKG